MAEPITPLPLATSRSRRPSRMLILALAVAVVAAGAVAVAARSFDRQRQRDAAGLTTAKSLLTVRQTESAAADEELAATTTAATAFDPAAAKLAAVAQQTTGLVDQGLTKAQQVDAAGLAHDVNAWNSAIADSNTLQQQQTAASTDYDNQFGTLPPP